MFVVLVFGCLLGISTASPTLRIVNGDKTAETEAPYFVSVTTYDNEATKNVIEFCGGTILSAKYILTAAHCLPGVSYYEVVAGTHLLHGKNRTVVNGRQYIVHSQYVPAPTVHNDIAILELDKPLDLSGSRIKPVQLPSKSEAGQSYVGQYGRIFGRGDVKSNQPWNVYTEELRYLVTKIISNADCKKDFNTVWDRNVCTSGWDGGKRIGACTGDSGGPLIYQDKEIGIVSYGADSCGGGEPTVFTDVGKYLDWIEQNSDVIIKN